MQDTLELWRARLVALFEAEGRGPAWVNDGQLQQRNRSQLYSQNYPVAPSYPNAPLFTNDCAALPSFFQTWLLIDAALLFCNIPVVPVGSTRPELWSGDATIAWPCPAANTLCASAADAMEGAPLALSTCTGSVLQQFQYNNGTGFITQPSGLCFTQTVNNAIVMAACQPGNINQVWTVVNASSIAPTTSPEGVCLTAMQNWGLV